PQLKKYLEADVLLSKKEVPLFEEEIQIPEEQRAFGFVSSPIKSMTFDISKYGDSDWFELDVLEKLESMEDPHRIIVKAPQELEGKKFLSTLGFEEDESVQEKARARIFTLIKNQAFDLKASALSGNTWEIILSFKKPRQFMGRYLTSIKLSLPDGELIESVIRSNKQRATLTTIWKQLEGSQQSNEDALRQALSQLVVVGLFDLKIQDDHSREKFVLKFSDKETRAKYSALVLTEEDVRKARLQKRQERQQRLAAQTSNAQTDNFVPIDYVFQNQVRKEFIRLIESSGYVVSDYLFNALREVFGETQSEIIDAISTNEDSLDLLLLYLEEQSVSDQDSHESKTYEALFSKGKNTRMSRERLGSLFSEIRKGDLLLLVSKGDFLSSPEKTASYIGQIAWNK
ncbi:hypothetical protein MNBD_BACTEROID05-345, partial [hydrothermal vent metagenome]